MPDPSKSSEWEKLLEHAALLQAKVPSAVLVGGYRGGPACKAPYFFRS
jgi:hypothetical protein